MAESSSNSDSLLFSIALHGGAGAIATDLDGAPFRQALTTIVTSAYAFAASLAKQSIVPDVAAVEVVEYVVQLLEDCPLFNAGCGSVYAHTGEHELEASIMDGRNLQCGAAAMLRHTKNPISLARVIMDRTPHALMVGESAEELGAQEGLHMVEQSYFHTERRYQQLLTARAAKIVARDHDISTPKPKEWLPESCATTTAPKSTLATLTDPQPTLMNDGGNTVGAVVMFNGHVAAATSTGGLTNKLSGRLGDTPIIGAGTYANDESCAVSGTGIGEEFLRRCVAHDVCARMRYAGLSLQDAVNKVVHETLPASTGGIIAVDARGNICMDFNCIGMFRAACDSDGHFCVGIYGDDEPLELTAQLPDLLTTLHERSPRIAKSLLDKRSSHVQWTEYAIVFPAQNARSADEENLLHGVIIQSRQEAQADDETKSPLTDRETP